VTSATGTWNTTLVSPMGSNEVIFELVEFDGMITGTATAEGETVPVLEGVANGSELSWNMSVTKPMKLNLVVTMTRNGDTIDGKAKAKMLPPVQISGSRVS
jgi:hypothetical protein